MKRKPDTIRSLMADLKKEKEYSQYLFNKVNELVVDYNNLKGQIANQAGTITSAYSKVEEKQSENENLKAQIKAYHELVNLKTK